MIANIPLLYMMYCTLIFLVKDTAVKCIVDNIIVKYKIGYPINLVEHS